MELFNNKDEVCQLMDKLLIQSLELIEEDVTLKLSIEKLTHDGYILIAKTRYTQGQNKTTLSIASLPTENSKECKALQTVIRSQDEIGTIQHELETHPVNKETEHSDPINWFGVLVPQTLRTAKEQFQKATQLVIESANVEQKLKINYENFEKLKRIKQGFEAEE